MLLITFLNKIISLKVAHLFILSISCFLIGYVIARLTQPKTKKKKDEPDFKEYLGLVWQVNTIENGEITVGDYPFCPRCKIELKKSSDPETIFSNIKFNCSNSECNFTFTTNQDVLNKAREGIKILIEAEQRGDFKSK